jgi:cytochrome P450
MNVRKFFFHNKLNKQMPSPPFPKGVRYKILGHLAEMLDSAKLKNQNPGMGLTNLRKDWYKRANSKTVLLNFIGNKVILCSDPAVYREVLGPKQDSFTNTISLKIVLGYFFKNSMIVVDGEQWQRIRKVVQRALNKQDLDVVVPIIADTTRELFSKNDVNKMDTITLLYRITFDVFHRVMYGWDPKSVQFANESSEILNSCNIIAESVGKRIFFPFPILWKLPTKENRNIDSAKAKITNFISSFIQNRRENLPKNKESLSQSTKMTNTLLDAMIIASDLGEDGGMTNEELIDQIFTMFFGAYDTTSNTLQFLLNYLARYPEVQEKLRKNISLKFPNGIKGIEKASLKDIESIDYLRYFIDEVNRLHAIAPFLGKDCINDTIIADFEVKKGTGFIVDHNTVGQDPFFWNGQSDLDKFRPERWEEFTPSKIESPMPFGFGGRICLGRKIAISQLKGFITIILSQYKVSLRNVDEELDLDMVLGLNIKPSNGNIDFTELV